MYAQPSPPARPLTLMRHLTPHLSGFTLLVPRGQAGVLCAGLLAASALLLLGAPPTHAQSMYADPLARQAGDVVTIILAEETSARRSSSYANRSSARSGGGASLDSPSIAGTFGVDAEFNNQSDNENRTLQSDLLQGKITARVTDTDEAGNLIVEGERRLNVNGVTHLMRVSGTVRPFDVRSDNTLYSYEIADAEVEYRRAGFTRRYTKPGFMAKAGMVAALGLAIFFGAQ